MPWWPPPNPRKGGKPACRYSASSPGGKMGLRGGSQSLLLFMSDLIVSRLTLPALSLPVVSLALSSLSSLLFSLFSSAWLSRLLLSPLCRFSYLWLEDSTCSSLGLVGRSQGSLSLSPLCLGASMGDWRQGWGEELGPVEWRGRLRWGL